MMNSLSSFPHDLDSHSLRAYHPAKHLLAAIENFGLNEEQMAKIIHYVAYLCKWNQHANLTAITAIDEIYTHHILDSLAAYFLWEKIFNLQNLEKNEPIYVLDIGSGAGLPSAMWAICNQNLQIHSIDCVGKKIAFQKMVKINLHLNNFHPQHMRIEKMQTNALVWDFIMARAYADVDKIFSDTKHLPKHGKGAYFLLKGKILPDMQKAQKSHADSQILKIDVPFLDAARHAMIVPFASLPAFL